VSEYDEELRRRILRGDDIPSVRMWFIRMIAASPDIRETEFTELEFKFWRDTVADFREWQANRKLN